MKKFELIDSEKDIFINYICNNYYKQKNIKNEVGLLKTKSIQEIKDYLSKNEFFEEDEEDENGEITE